MDGLGEGFVTRDEGRGMHASGVGSPRMEEVEDERPRTRSKSQQWWRKDTFDGMKRMRIRGQGLRVNKAGEEEYL
jgi:hypothetical protein